MSIKKIPNWLLKKRLQDEATLIKISKGTIDPPDNVYGEVIETETEYTIKGHIDLIGYDDLRFVEPGILTVGDARAIFRSSYTSKGTVVTVNSGDKITRNGRSYRVQEVTPTTHRDGSTITVEAYLKRI